jgi:DNA-binding NtrC family response regulator
MARVTIVEDNLDTRVLLMTSLRASGFDVVESETAEDALAWVLGGEIDVLITDLDLGPDVKSGEWLIQETQKVSAKIFVGIYSGSTRAESIAHMFNVPIWNKTGTSVDALAQHLSPLISRCRTGTFPEVGMSLGSHGSNIRYM